MPLRKQPHVAHQTKANVALVIFDGHECSHTPAVNRYGRYCVRGCQFARTVLIHSVCSHASFPKLSAFGLDLVTVS